jgi:hypothetical protein
MNRTIALNAAAIIGILIAASAVWSSDQPSSTQRIPQFENSHVKVWKSTIVPNVPLALHRHDHGRVIIVLQGGTDCELPDLNLDRNKYLSPHGSTIPIARPQNQSKSQLEYLLMEAMERTAR